MWEQPGALANPGLLERPCLPGSAKKQLPVIARMYQNSEPVTIDKAHTRRERQTESLLP